MRDKTALLIENAASTYGVFGTWAVFAPGGANVRSNDLSDLLVSVSQAVADMIGDEYPEAQEYF